jgi:hypothetical protein
MRFLFFILAVLTGLGCSPKLPLPPPPVLEDFVDNSDCNFYNDYSAKERLSRKPFGQSEKIELVSFDGEYEEMLDSVVYKGCCRHEIPKKDSKIDRSQLQEIIPLSTLQLDSLTNIFFNYDYGRAENGLISNPDVGCYRPRQAVLFFRKKTDTEPFAYFEICLECQYVKTFPKQYELGNFCDGKYDMLREFFRQTGIKYGLDGRR